MENQLIGNSPIATTGDVDVTVNLSVSGKDTADNLKVNDVVGNKTDTVAGTSLVSLTKQILASVGDDEETDVDDIQTNVGDASSDNLKSIVAKLGNDTLTVKARLDAIDTEIGLTALNSTVAKDSTVMKTAGYTAPDNTSIAAIKLKTDTIPTNPLGSADITVDTANAATNTTIRDVIGNKTDTTAGNSLYSEILKVLALFPVDTKNSAANTTITDVIGNKTDDEAGTSLMSAAFMLQAHVHSASQVYPTLANGVTLTTAAGAWALGNYAVVVPASTITNVFDIHSVHIGAYSANTTFEIVLYSGANGEEVECGRVRFTRTSNTNPGAYLPFMTPLIAANTQIKAKIACAGGGGATCVMSIFYHTY